MKTKLFTEFIGTAFLLVAVTGSGIMGDNLSAGNTAVALLGNSIATGCGLYVLITLLAPISGAHINPAVSLMMWRDGELDIPALLGYITAQVTGAIAGVWLTHIMFASPIIQISTNPRHNLGIWISEMVSTLVLLTVVRLGIKYANDKVAMLVALVVTGGYWFTSSTFFANPAVTLARSLTNTFVGIRPTDVWSFLSAQIVAVLLIALWIKVESNNTTRSISA